MLEDNPTQNPPKNKGGRPRTRIPKDPNAPKNKGGRPRKNLPITTRLPRIEVDDDLPLDDETQYAAALASRNRQRRRIEALADALYDAIDNKVAARLPVDKSDYELFKEYELRLRLIDNDILDLRKTRLEERKLEQALRSANESKVTTVNITFAPPPPPVTPPYNAADYIKTDQETVEDESE